MFTYQFNPLPEIFTTRFKLRAPSPVPDAAAIAILRSDPLVNQFLHRSSSITIAEGQQFLEKIVANEAIYWVITAKEDGQLVGTICYWNIVPALEEAEIGYELQSAFFGQGIMQEVLPVVIRFGFEAMQLKKITALPFDGNERSRKLLEKQGFTIDDAVRQRLEKEDDLTNIVCYSLTNPTA